MNLDELRSVQSKERQKDSLQNLRPSFYQEVGEYIADLEAERDRVAEAADDPFSSPEVGRLTDEIETAKDVVEAIYERRMGKLVKQASLAAAGMPADDEGLTAEEADLFDDLVDRIGSNKSRVLDVLEGVDTEATTGGTGGEGDVDAGGEPRAGPEMAGSDSTPAPGTDPTAVDPMGESSAEGPTAPDATETADDAPPVPPQEPPAEGAAAGGDGPDSAPAPEADPGADAADDSSGVTPADVMGGEGPDLGRDEGTTDPEPTEPNADPDGSAGDPRPDAAGSGSTSAASHDVDADVDRVTVRITRDIGSILGVDDREYSLSSDDIVTLPEQNADPLLEQDAAEPLE